MIIDKIFGIDGPISNEFTDYEVRPSQVEMSKAVYSAFVNNTDLIAEAPCGVGKSLAYLVPAIIIVRDQRDRIQESVEDNTPPSRVVIATANIALQEQLVNKDLPFLKKTLKDFSFALLKGRSNYLCKRLVTKLRKEPPIFGNSTHQQILDWAKRTKTGDKNELDFETSFTWNHFSSSADDCLHDKCPHSKECYATLAKKHASECDILVCNYHLLFADLMVREATEDQANVIPSYDYLVCDEGHKAANIARAFFGWILGQGQITQVENVCKRGIKILEKHKRHNELGEAFKILSDLEKGLKFLQKVSNLFFEDIARRNPNGKCMTHILSKNKISTIALIQALQQISISLQELVNTKILDTDDKISLQKTVGNINLYVQRLDEAQELKDSDSVYFTEYLPKSHTTRLVCRKIVINELLKEKLFSPLQSTIITSATLSVGGKCDFIKKDLGLDTADECVVDSPFDFSHQCALICSSAAPNPMDATYTEQVCTALESIINESQGRVLGLFTSVKNMQAAKSYLNDQKCECRVLCQGDRPRMQLIEEFKKDISSVLLGTESFWNGVDVPGEALSCLVIDRLPFKAATDPISKSLCDREGRQGFMRVSLPQAIIQFKQGVGRLIRRKSDTGVIVVLDNRICTKGYGTKFIRSLPPMPRANALKGSIQKFFEWVERRKSNETQT